MITAEQQKAAQEFAERWRSKIDEETKAHGKLDEKQFGDIFWDDLFRSVYGVEDLTAFLQRQKKVTTSHQGKCGTKSQTLYIDTYVPQTNVIIEQKSSNVNLMLPKKQSDGTVLTPYGQAKRYNDNLAYGEKARWIVTCNFEEFQVHDMDRLSTPPDVVRLADFGYDPRLLEILVNQETPHIRKDMKLSIGAGEIVSRIYDALCAQYQDGDSAESKHSLNVLCVRLVFCLYADSAGIFGQYGMFRNYLAAHRSGARNALLELFKVLDQQESERDPYMDTDLAQFPYVNGGLFRLTVVIPRITPEVVDLILNEAGSFDWKDVSPTIFGAIFESTLNPETQKQGGMHYTSTDNIHKVIDPLFFADLQSELETILETYKSVHGRRKHLNAFRDKLASLKFLDPACGSGNFLTETYLSLRRLENEAIGAMNEGQIAMDAADPIRVSIAQFYGIEINDFAVSVAQTALWIAEGQMLQETEKLLSMNIDYLPLTTAGHIVQGNALRIDWWDVVPKEELNYIMGNPPFVGKSFQTPDQKTDMEHSLAGVKRHGHLDYVACWFKMAADCIVDTDIKCAFVSTNSICQGIAVPTLWPYILQSNVHIDFAYRTFRWTSQSIEEAHVHVVIIGFSAGAAASKPRLYLDGGSSVKTCENINPYLLDAPNVVIVDRPTPIMSTRQMQVGSFPTDGGHLVIKGEEHDAFVRDNPEAAAYVRPYIGPRQLIDGESRYCLWLKASTPQERMTISSLAERIKEVKAYREQSTKLQTQRRAKTPHLFAEDRQPDSAYVMIPRTSSGNRDYVPMGFFTPDVIAGDTIILPSATLYDFGILNSRPHMAWMDIVVGRMKSDYRYSHTLVYNTFPWPDPTPAQKARIEKTAQAILDARALYPGANLADLYDRDAMPPELRKAHEDNDKAVLSAYGLKISASESEILGHLMTMYADLTRDR